MQRDALRVQLRLVLQSGGNLVQLGGVRPGPFVKAGRQLHGPQQEHHPKGIDDGVNHQRVTHIPLVDVQRGLHGHHIAAAADPRAAQRAEAHPGIRADEPLHHEKRRDEADDDGQRRGEKAQEHPRPQTQQIAKVAAQQHGKDHRVGQVVFQRAVSRLGLPQIPDLQRTQQHGDQITQHRGGQVPEKLLKRPLRRLFQRQERAGDKQQHGHISKTICNHINSLEKPPKAHAFGGFLFVSACRTEARGWRL